MHALAFRVRHRLVGLALSATPLAAVHAQVAIQVKSGTIWTSNIELKALAPITFRWRWDGAETPTSVAWQLATVTPTSTATTRASDVIASETGMRLPAKAGVYEEFAVTPAASWPAKFYIRVRVNIGRKSVYSRWSAVTVIQRDGISANPTCTIKAWRYGGEGSGNGVAIEPGSGMDQKDWSVQIVHFIFKNHASRTSVSYRRELKFLDDGQSMGLRSINVFSYDPRLMDPDQIQTTAPAQEDTLKFGLAPINWGYGPTGVLRFEAKTIPTSGPASSCSLTFSVF